MGIFSSLGDFVFGKPAESESESKNLAYPFISQTYGPQATGGVNAFNHLSNQLGIGQEGGFNNFLDNSGYGWVMDQGMQGLTNSAAGNYFLRSGATAKALQDRAMNIGKTYFDNYLDRVGQVAELGTRGGALITGAGDVSHGEESGAEKSKLGKILKVGAAIFSDRALKTDIERVGELSDGLPLYDYRYVWDDPETRRRGVMADEVGEYRPWALGPEIGGYATVDYSALGAV